MTSRHQVVGHDDHLKQHSPENLPPVLSNMRSGERLTWMGFAPARAGHAGSGIGTVTRILLKDQTAPAENGIYDWNGGAAALTRSVDADSATELSGATVTVQPEFGHPVVSRGGAGR